MLKANNELCLTCKKPDCSGICSQLRDEMSDVDTSKPIHEITWHGVTRSIGEWAEILGVNRTTLYRQINDFDNPDEALAHALSKGKAKSDLVAGSIEETYVRLSTMHLDYILYWNRLSGHDSSAGMVARYGAVRASPTNATSNPVERQALPELILSDDALYRRGWVACVLYMIEHYRQRNHDTPHPGDRMRAKLLEMRAIDGLTLRKMSDRLNEEMPYLTSTISPMRLRQYMEPIVHDVAEEALKRGLIRGTQK